MAESGHDVKLSLRDLNAEFYRITSPGHYERVEAIADAQGVCFLCPKCFATNGGPVGTHSVICWSRSRGVPDSESPGPGRWLLNGTGIDDLTLDGDGGSRSVQLLGGGCGWHGFINSGFAEGDIPE
jgi:hypothetical protein